jgi:hypothetical protein
MGCTGWHHDNKLAVAKWAVQDSLTTTKFAAEK